MNLFAVSNTEIKEARSLLAVVMSLVIHSGVIYYSKDFQPGISVPLADVKRMKLTFSSLNTTTATVTDSAYHSAPLITKMVVKKPARSVETRPIELIKQFKKNAPEKMTKAIAHKSKAQKSTIKQPSPVPVTPVNLVITKQLQQAKNDVIEIEVDGRNSNTDAGKFTSSLAHEKLLTVRLNPKFRSPPRPPVYPRQSIRRHQQGTALIRAKISRFGNVEELIIRQTSNYDALDQAAMAAVRKWQFEPAKSNGYNIASWVQVPVNFVLK